MRRFGTVGGGREVVGMVDAEEGFGRGMSMVRVGGR
jgi:hypothetical protein